MPTVDVNKLYVNNVAAYYESKVYGSIQNVKAVRSGNYVKYKKSSGTKTVELTKSRKFKNNQAFFTSVESEQSGAKLPAVEVTIQETTVLDGDKVSVESKFISRGKKAAVPLQSAAVVGSKEVVAAWAYEGDMKNFFEQKKIHYDLSTVLAVLRVVRKLVRDLFEAELYHLNMKWINVLYRFDPTDKTLYIGLGDLNASLPGAGHKNKFTFVHPSCVFLDGESLVFRIRKGMELNGTPESNREKANCITDFSFACMLLEFAYQKGYVGTTGDVRQHRFRLFDLQHLRGRFYPVAALSFLTEGGVGFLKTLANTVGSEDEMAYLRETLSVQSKLKKMIIKKEQKTQELLQTIAEKDPVNQGAVLRKNMT